MMSAVTTPRPKPPSRARRSSARNSAALNLPHPNGPPPPYDPFEDDLPIPDEQLQAASTLASSREESPRRPRLGRTSSLPTLHSPPATATRETFNKAPETPTIEEDESLDWAALQASDVRDLVRKMQDVIRVRERELELSAAFGKALLEKNQMLKIKHDDLLSRLPPSSPSNPISPRSAHTQQRSDSWSTDDEAVNPPSPSDIFTPPRRYTHARRVSASPQALAFLSEQNAELLAQVEKLQLETVEAQNAGQLKLRKIEKEVEGLYSELKEVLARNAELEAQARRTVAEEAQRKKKEREQRVLAIRGKGKFEDDVFVEDGIRDFAPSSSRSSISSFSGSGSNRSLSNFHSPSIPYVSSLAPIPAASEAEEVPSAEPQPPTLGRSASEGEYAVVSQLLVKIHELEEANKEIVAQHREQNERLDRAEREAEEMRKMYEGLEEEVSMNSDMDHSFPRISTPSSVRSLREELTGTRTPRSRSRTRSLTSSRVKRTFRSGGNNKVVFPKSSRPRKPLSSDMFLTPEEGPSPPSTPTKSKGTLDLTNLDNLVIDLESPPRDSSTPAPSIRIQFPSGTSASTSQDLGVEQPPSDDEGLLSANPSPAKSMLRAVSSLQSIVSYVDAGRNLQNELGNEFGENWEIGGSLGRSAGLMVDYNESFESFASAHEVLGQVPFDGAEEEGALITNTERCEGEDQSNENNQVAEQMHPAMAALQTALDPANAGKHLNSDEHILPVSSLAQAPGETFYLLAKAVHARPNKLLNDNNVPRLLQLPRTPPKERTEDPWETNVYPDLPDEQEPVKRLKEKSRREMALDRMATTAERRRFSYVFKDDDQDQYEIIEAVPDAPPPSKYDPHAFAEKLKNSSASTLFELLLLVQFLVILGVFVWQIARRGPKAVDAAKKVN